MLINNTNSTICIIKIALVLATALIVSFIKSTRKRWFYGR
jgi:thiamine transporter ThiT